MNPLLIAKGVGGLHNKAKPYYKYVILLLVLLLVTGRLKKIIEGIKTRLQVQRYSDNPLAQFDSERVAMLLHEALNRGPFNLFEDEAFIIETVNNIPSYGEFMNVVNVYQRRYSKDLLFLLRKHLTNKQYNKLRYK